jgi:hypothetical protein
MKVFSVHYKFSSGKIKPKAIKTKLSNTELKDSNFLDDFLTERQEKQKANQLKKGGSLLLKLAIPVAKKYL